MNANGQKKSAIFYGSVAAVAFPVAIPGVYDYKIPDRLINRVTPGLPALVEVKTRRLWGVVVEVKRESAAAGKFELKEIIDIKEGHWADSNRTLLKLYEWIARYYHCPVGRVFRPVAGKNVVNAKAKTATVYRAANPYNIINNAADAGGDVVSVNNIHTADDGSDSNSGNDADGSGGDVVSVNNIHTADDGSDSNSGNDADGSGGDVVSVNNIHTSNNDIAPTDAHNADGIGGDVVSVNNIHTSNNDIAPTDAHNADGSDGDAVHINNARASDRGHDPAAPPTLNSRLRDALAKISRLTQPMTAAQLKTELGIAAATISTLRKKGYIVAETATVIRDAGGGAFPGGGAADAPLSAEQLACVERVAASFDAPDKPFLLYGITGSGKTHVYIELAKRALAAGRGAIILVPEIGLTPQTISRFRAAIGDAVAVIHSRMSDGERRDSLQEVAAGRRRAVVGVRSALLCPMENPGLIVVDEEHDGSYKQSDADPRYNARDVAVMRGLMQRAAVVLGSATPSVESYRNALSGKYNLLTLNARFGAARLPDVKIIDMTAEHREKNWTILSRYLAARMGEELGRGRQAILLLNRRGFSTSLLCKDCGYTHQCPNCSVSLRYHKADTVLKCHVCGREEAALALCPNCGGSHIKYKGTGIQKAEETLASAFPTARVLRMDQDTTRRKGSHAAILDAFARGSADVLIGTQMVAKGLNFPNVTLVGVLHADTGLYFPDFRASERTFQLLTQVAGRAGRADLPGEVVIQTYRPDAPAVRFAADHDYLSFYAREIKHREELSYPPFGKLARVVAESADESAAAAFLAKAAREAAAAAPGKIKVLGPAEAVLARADNVYRYSMLLKSPSAATIGEALNRVSSLAAAEPVAGGGRCVIDVDPQNMM